MGLPHPTLLLLLLAQLALLLSTTSRAQLLSLSQPPAQPPSHHHHHHHHHLSPHLGLHQPPAQPPSHHLSPHLGLPQPPAQPPSHHHHHHPLSPHHHPLSPHHHPRHHHLHPHTDPPSPSPSYPPLHPPTHHPSLKPPALPPVKAPAHPPHFPPAKPPTHPPVHPLPRKAVAVQGVVFCKNCTFSGTDTLLGAKPLSGATVVLKCRNTVYSTKEKATTDHNGYFFMMAPKTVTSYGAHKCRVYLAAPPRGANCTHLTDLNGGVSGAFLMPMPSLAALPYVVFNVGPFAFEPFKLYCPKH